MVSWNDPRVVVAIAAAIITFMSLCWGIVVYIRKNTRKIKVKVNHLMIFADNPLSGGFTPAIGVLGVKAINHTNEDVFIKGWYIKTSKKINIMGIKTDGLSSFDTTRSIKYPYQLKKGEVFSDNSGVRSIINAIGNQLTPNSKMWVIVSDTFDNEFKSQKFTYKNLLNLLETENMDLKKHHLK